MSWEIVKLDSCVNILSGFAFKSNCFNSNQEGMPLIRIRNVVESKIETYYSGEYDDQYLIKKGDLLVGMDGDFNRQKWNNEPALLNQRVCKITPISEKINASYLYHLLPKELDRIHAITPCVTVKHLSVQKIKDIELILPSLPEQQRIADILDKAEAITQKRAQVLTLCDEFLRATFLDMFGDPVSNPKGWDIYNWEKVIDIKNGKNQKKVAQENGEYAIFGSGGEMGRANDFITPAFSVIIGRKGNINDPILITEPVWNVDTAFGLVPNIEMLLHDYLYLFCVFFDFLRLNKTVTIPSLRKVDLYEIQIPIPPIELQQKFSEIVEKVNTIKARIQHAQELPLFDALSQQAFKGELTQ